MVALLLGMGTLCAQVTPYEYHNRWYLSLQGGPLYFNGDCTYVYREKGPWMGPFTFSGGASLGYNITNGHEVRLTASFGPRRASCISYKDALYPYTFKSASLFADYVLAFRALAEDFSAFNPKLYAGAGAAYTFGFTDPQHPQRHVNGPNWVAGFHVGSVMEYDFPSGFGLFADLGLTFLSDTYDGQGWYNFPVDMEIGFNIGVVFHFKRHKR